MLTIGLNLRFLTSLPAIGNLILSFTMSIRAFLQSRLEGLSISSSSFGVGPKFFFDLTRVANLVDEHIECYPLSVSCINGGDIDKSNFLLTENGVFGKFSDLCNLANEIIPGWCGSESNTARTFATFASNFLCSPQITIATFEHDSSCQNPQTYVPLYVFGNFLLHRLVKKNVVLKPTTKISKNCRSSDTSSSSSSRSGLLDKENNSQDFHISLLIILLSKNIPNITTKGHGYGNAKIGVLKSLSCCQQEQRIVSIPVDRITITAKCLENLRQAYMEGFIWALVPFDENQPLEFLKSQKFNVDCVKKMFGDVPSKKTFISSSDRSLIVRPLVGKVPKCSRLSSALEWVSTKYFSCINKQYCDIKTSLHYHRLSRVLRINFVVSAETKSWHKLLLFLGSEQKIVNQLTT